MNKVNNHIDRRRALKLLSGLAGCYFLPTQRLVANESAPITKRIPSSGEQIPVIGMGTSRTFDAIGDSEMMVNLGKVLTAFFENGGTFIDSSPMYGSSEQVIGKLLKAVKPESLFAATKVWINGKQSGIEQMETSRQLWGVKRFDLMQIHNLRDWKVHLQTLKQMKAAKQIRYIGITTSHGRDHNELYSALASQPFDFVQLSYHIANREVEKKLLPLARDRGIAVIVNRPFARGSLFRKTKGKPLPEWAAEFECTSWAQFFLKYAASHPAVTCTIPATSKVHHMVDNMGAGFGRLPDEGLRKKMQTYFADI